MGVRNFLVLFFAAMAISLVILVVFFSLFFKNIDLTFNTKMPESAPNPLEEKAQPQVTTLPKKDEHFKADGIQRSTVNVPTDISHRASESSDSASSETGPAIGVQSDPSAAKPKTTNAPQADLNAPTPDRSVEDVTPESSGGTPSREVNAPTSGRGSVSTVPPVPAPRIPRLRTTKSRPAQQTVPTEIPHDDQPIAPVPVAPSAQPAPDTQQEQAPIPSGTPSGAIPSTRHQVYLDHFAGPEQAQAAAERLQAQGIPAIVRFNRSNQPMVQIGTYANRNNAEQMASRTGAKLKTLP